MNKRTDWPEWANYKTVDLDGATKFHELKPEIYLYTWQSMGRTEFADQRDIHWRDSLERRAQHE